MDRIFNFTVPGFFLWQLLILLPSKVILNRVADIIVSLIPLTSLSRIMKLMHKILPYLKIHLEFKDNPIKSLEVIKK